MEFRPHFTTHEILFRFRLRPFMKMEILILWQMNVLLGVWGAELCVCLCSRVV